MVSLIRPRPKGAAVDRRDIIELLATLDDAEFQAVADEARGHSLISLGELVLEGLAPDIGSLAKKLGDAVVIDDVGRRCCTRDTARGLFTARAEQIAQQKAENRRQREEFNARREHLRAQREERQQATARDGASRTTSFPPPNWEPTARVRGWDK